MPSNHLILCHPLLLLPSVFPSIRVFSNESALCIGWRKYWSFSCSISLSNSPLFPQHFFFFFCHTSRHVDPSSLTRGRVWICIFYCKPLELFLVIYWPICAACGILVPPPGIEPRPSAVKTWSPNHWTTRNIFSHTWTIFRRCTELLRSTVMIPPLSSPSHGQRKVLSKCQWS